HCALDPGQIERAELLPLRYDYECVRALSARVGAIAVFDVADRALGLFHSHRVIGPNCSTEILEGSDNGDRRRIAHVIRIGLESQTEYRDGLPSYATAESRSYLPGHPTLADIVHGRDCFDDA